MRSRSTRRDKVYVLTALFLGAITVVEVLTYAAPDFFLWWADSLAGRRC